MAMVVFTDREMQRAWRTNLEVSKQGIRTNAHRLLLFYAVECGLKAVLMKRASVTCTNGCESIRQAQHDINKLLDALNAGRALKLPSTTSMTPIKNKAAEQPRPVDCGQLNPMWRYGGSIDTAYKSTYSDQSLEDSLSKISHWIQEQLSGA